MQIGIDGARTVLLADTSQIRSLLHALSSGVDPEEVLGRVTTWPPEVVGALQRLESAGLIVRTDEVLAELGADAPAPGTVSALFASDPTGARSRLRRRRGARWQVQGTEPWRTDLEEQLAGQGVGAAVAGVRSSPTGPLGDVVVTAGEALRDHADRLVHDGRPHLWVAVLADRARIGPFVVPGTTACLRCRDAALAEDDPRRLVAVAQAGSTPPGALPAPADPLTARLAVTIAAREVLAYVDGERPATFSSTLEIPLIGIPQHRTWPRHGWCGCAWDDIDAG